MGAGFQCLRWMIMRKKGVNRKMIYRDNNLEYHEKEIIRLKGELEDTKNFILNNYMIMSPAKLKPLLERVGGLGAQINYHERWF